MNTMAVIINAEGVNIQTIMLTKNQQTICTNQLPAGVYVLNTELGSSPFILIK